ncbi:MULTISPECIES: ribonuclease J [unclassified Mycoplasma]|uniref:ribonuclease J n=1 Tax=unclassified Mycoplasma TaxID=2683645 RepID=UPI00216AFF31|nr:MULTISPECIES: ribonuclease J [unclassified Mycoplasma]MCS4536531.1 ribonuclease J [Mycoplasma sp. CSL7475-4]MCT4469649.1 ribonuclease J [Mycoplasma sp. HS2188]
MKPTRLVAIGGVQEIGKSSLFVEYDDNIFIVDAGIKFADTAQTGIKGIIPDYSYLAKNKHKIKGLFITHGHEDHIGGVVYLVKQVPLKKIFAPRIAIQYLKLKFEEHKVPGDIEFVEIEKSAVHRFGKCSVDFWSAQHSIPDAFGIRINTPNGSIMCTGDFRFDYNPIGESYTDFARLDQIGKEGLTVLLSDSTNAMRPFHSPSENDILKDIEKYMRQATRKIIITAFASNLTRVKAIIELVAKLGKKVATFGRSMVNGVKIGRKLGYINVDNNVLVDKKQVSNVPDKDLVILTTGSQGEQLAALARMSHGKHQSVKIEKGDLIIFSSSPIPGNHMVIELLVNRLAKLGADIKENGVDGYLHTSGHAYKHEHDKIFQLTKPKYFIPYHGEYRMSIVHGQSAVRNGVNPDNVFIPEKGRVYNIIKGVVSETDEKIDYGPIYIDGHNVLNLNANVIKERQQLAESGFVNICLVIDRKNKNIIGRPSLISRGAFYVKTSLPLVTEAKRVAHGAALYYIKNTEEFNIVELKQLIVDRLENLFYKEKRRKPIIIPTILYTDDADDEVLKNSEISFEKKSKSNDKTKSILKNIRSEMFGDKSELDDDIHDDEEDIE